jgi:peptide deformylase
VHAPEIEQLIQDLLDTCKSKEDITAGLSAPQIGVNLDVIVCRRMDVEEEKEITLPEKEAWEIMINPELIKVYGNESTYWEGCLSVGEGPEGLYAPVTRKDIAEIKYLTPAGEQKQLKCKGFFAHIVQHELDHLKGVLFLKYVPDLSMIWKSKDLDKYYQEHGEYPEV